MSVSFTPGPWSVDIVGDVCAKNLCVAIVSIGNRPEADQEADAHLIAAAPELYEALERLSGAMDELDIMGLDGEFNGAQAALAKARGEA